MNFCQCLLQNSGAVYNDVTPIVHSGAGLKVANLDIPDALFLIPFRMVELVL